MTNQEREDWNAASNVFQTHFPHVPLLDDDHPMMPKESAEFRNQVIAAIIDGRERLRVDLSVA